MAVHREMNSYWERSAGTILVTGALSHVGMLVTKRLCEAGWGVRVLIPQGHLGDRTFPERAILCEGNLLDPDSLRRALRHCHKVIHLEELGFGYDSTRLRTVNVEGTRHLVQASKAEGVGQFVLLSSLQANFRNSTLYGKSKKVAEDVLRGSALAWTILRPTLLVGSHGSPEFRLLRWWAKHSRWFPLPLGGHVLKQPLHEEDLVDAICRLVEAPASRVAHQTYTLAGLESMTLLGLVDMITGESQMGERHVFSLPQKIVDIMLRVMQRFSRKHSFTLAEAWREAGQDATPDVEPARRDFGFHPLPLAGRLFQTTMLSNVNKVAEVSTMEPIRRNPHPPRPVLSRRNT